MKKTTILLLVLIFVAAVLRFYQVTENPKALYGDGITAVYDAYSILKTGGFDQKGNFLPLVFSLGGGRPGGYVYATVPFVALLGPTVMASQIVSVLSGIGIIVLLYLLGKTLISKGVGLTAAGIGAINPWELSLSRGPYESHFALFLTLLGIYSFLKGLKNKLWFLFFALSFSLAVQTYSTYRLTIPLLTLILLFWARKDLKSLFKNFTLIASLIIIAASIILSIYLTISRGSEDRFNIINIFKDPTLRSAISQKVNSERLLDSLSPTASNAIHTPQAEIIGILAENYFKNLLPDFLFIHGDGQVRHNPAEMGGFFWADAAFLVLGVLYLFKSKRSLFFLLLGWIFISPVPTSLVGGAHALRSSLLLPPIILLIGAGLHKLINMPKKSPRNISIAVLFVIFFIQFTFFLDRFYFVAPQKHARFYSYPAKEAFLLAEKNKNKFDYIILSNDIDNMEFAYPFYAKTEPKLVIEQNKIRTKIGEFQFFKYDNVYIGSLPHTRIMAFVQDLPGSALYIGSDKEEKTMDKYKIIRGFDKLPDLIVTATGQIPDLEVTDTR